VTHCPVQVYFGGTSIGERISISRQWSTVGRQPNYVHLSMNSAISGGWRVGRWQVPSSAVNIRLDLYNFTFWID
jgi:hypothetical protein